MNFNIHNAGKTNPKYKGMIIENITAASMKEAVKIANARYGKGTTYVTEVK